MHNTEYPLFTLQKQSKDVAHPISFIGIGPKESTGELGEFYQEIHKILEEVHNTQCSQLAIDKLISLAKER